MVNARATRGGRVRKGTWRPPVVLAVALAAAVAGLAYAAWSASGGSSSTGRDFRVVWVAGHIWSEGHTPYDQASYIEAYERLIGPFHPDLRFQYPPSWSPLCLLLAQLPFRTAELVWRGVNLVALVGTVALSCLWRRASGRRVTTTAALVLLAVACGLQATAITMALGQMSLLAALGVALALYGTARASTLLLAVGLAGAALKPQFAVVLAIAVLVAGHWRAFLLAGAVGVLAAVPAFWLTGVGTTLRAGIDAGRTYGAIGSNAPPELVGWPHLFGLMHGPWPAWCSLLLGLLAGAAIGLVARRADRPAPPRLDQPPPLNPVGFAIPALVATYFLMPLHVYDAVMLIPIIAYVMVAGLRQAWPLLPGLLLIYRDGNLAAWIGLANPASRVFTGSLSSAIGGALLLAGAGLLAWTLSRSQRALDAELDADAIAA
jgi:hypothetical protein